LTLRSRRGSRRRGRRRDSRDRDRCHGSGFGGGRFRDNRFGGDRFLRFPPGRFAFWRLGRDQRRLVGKVDRLLREVLCGSGRERPFAHRRHGRSYRSYVVLGFDRKSRGHIEDVVRR
jgi:hypothetical protein